MAQFAMDVAARPRTPFAFRRAQEGWRDQIASLVAQTDGAFCRMTPPASLLETLGMNRVVIDGDDLQYLFHIRRARSGADGGLSSLFDYAEAARTYIAEQSLARRCACLIVSSTHDQQLVRSKNTAVVANGVDLEPASPTQVTRDPATILFVGHCGWGPNVDGLHWFLGEVWPMVRHLRPDARLIIAGQMASPAAIPFADRPEVTLLENVPFLRPLYDRASVAIVPLRFAAGTRIKILEALGYGVPAVSTTPGALGLAERFGASLGLAIADTPVAFAEAIHSGLSDMGFYERATRGSAVVRSEFSWETTTRAVATEIEGWITESSDRHRKARAR